MCAMEHFPDTRRFGPIRDCTLGTNLSSVIFAAWLLQKVTAHEISDTIQYIQAQGARI